MEDIASFAIWVMIGLLVANMTISTIGDMPYFKQYGLAPAFDQSPPSGIISGLAGNLDAIIAGLTGANYSSSDQPTISKLGTAQATEASNGLFSSFAGMLFRWAQLADYFASNLGVFGSVIYIFTNFLQIIQLVGIFVLISRVIGVARLAVFGA